MSKLTEAERDFLTWLNWQTRVNPDRVQPLTVPRVPIRYCVGELAVRGNPIVSTTFEASLLPRFATVTTQWPDW